MESQNQNCYALASLDVHICTNTSLEATLKRGFIVTVLALAASQCTRSCYQSIVFIVYTAKKVQFSDEVQVSEPVIEEEVQINESRIDECLLLLQNADPTGENVPDPAHLPALEGEQLFKNVLVNQNNNIFLLQKTSPSGEIVVHLPHLLVLGEKELL